MSRLARRAEEGRSLWGRIRDVALTDVGVLVRGLDEGSLEAIEELLLEADFGVAATLRLVDRMESVSRGGKVRTEQDFRDALEGELLALLEGRDRTLATAAAGPTVYLFVGVNGVGKTTTLAKLAHRLHAAGQRPLLAAADTFRAGAVDQLRVWAERVDAGFVGARPGADPAAVAFDAVDAAEARGHDVVLVDTAGRLHTQRDLMSELTKVERVLARRLPGAPHETLLVLDATVGQNAVAQARTFAGALEVSGFALAKLDSTARGGIVVALETELDVPVKLVGTGEAAADLEPFRPADFVRGVLAP
ncbi:MAG: signal recognition particle-docking protein FtsY [Gemmatimonadota bacterium]